MATVISESELPVMDATLFQHTPYYCEENVYLLCKTLCENGVADSTGSDLFVVFISNEKKQVPLWQQKASKRTDGIVIWDYHVICIQRKKQSDSEPLVYDLDSTLPFPSLLASYVTETIQPSFQLFAEYQRYIHRSYLRIIASNLRLPYVLVWFEIRFFRVVQAPLFFKHFASDRRHMKGPDGSWTAQPPPYQPIVAQDGILHNLSEYIAMSGADTSSSLDPETVRAAISQKLGVVVSHSQLQDLFTILP